MEKKIQNKKLNKKDHKKINKGARYTKNGLLYAGAFLTVKPFIKKYGGQILTVSKNIILKK